MPILIHNSLTKTKDEFNPQEKGKVKIYSCGVTVYDDCHIGHGRSLFIFDVIVRYLRYRGYKVKFARNITDIDDKIINKAKELGITTKELSEKYIASYYNDLELLGIEKADFEPKATENIDGMIKHIQLLIEKGFAYEIDGDIYFSVKKFKDYGRLSGQNLEQMLAGARVEKDERKKDPLDFALWKKSKEGEPKWNSSWGEGRPGWHIECSVMSMKYLGDTFDIHAGGRDLIFPHHENEIAQSEALTGKPFAKYWIHHGLLTINGQKMAKSLGNFIIIRDVLNRYPSDILKIFYLQAHYSSPIDFSWDKLEEAKKAYERFIILFQKLDREFGTRNLAKLPDGSTGNINKFREEFEKAMDDDFNTPLSLAVLFNMVNKCNKILDNKQDDRRFMLQYALKTILELGSILGLSFQNIQEDKSDTWVTIAMAQREQLRKDGEFDEADKIRKMLNEKGIILEDINDGKTLWRRKL